MTVGPEKQYRNNAVALCTHLGSIPSTIYGSQYWPRVMLGWVLSIPPNTHKVRCQQGHVLSKTFQRIFPWPSWFLEVADNTDISYVASSFLFYHHMALFLSILLSEFLLFCRMSITVLGDPSRISINSWFCL